MYTIRTFGGFVIEKDGRQTDHPRVHRKSLAILAVLAAEESTGREKLMSLLWPDSDQERAKGSLNQALHLLRQHFGAPDVLTGTIEIRLNPIYFTSDVSLFRKALAEKDHPGAARLYTGRFLDGIHMDAAPEFEEWADSHRLDLEKIYLGVLENLAVAAEAKNDYLTAAGWWRKLQSADPYNSRVAAALMLALGHAGERAAALLHARRHQALLKEDLNMKPDLKIDELAGQLRSAGSVPGQNAEQDASATGEPEDKPTENRWDSAPYITGLNEKQVWQPLLRWTRFSVFLLVSILITGTVAAFWILNRQNAEPTTRSEALPVIPQDGSIAVLPFINLSPDDDEVYLSDGITDEITSSLSRAKGLKVAGRTSAFRFRGMNPELREIREKLGVSHFLEGSVRRSGNLIRVNVQLVSTETGYRIWAESYERRAEDIFEVMDEIARSVAAEMPAGSTAGTHISGRAGPAPDISVYELYLRGLYFFNQLQIQRSVNYLEEAVRKDPKFAHAYAALAEAYAVPAAYNELSAIDLRSKGMEAAKTALQINPDLAGAHSALGWLHMSGFEWDEAGESLRRALELDPDAPRVRLYYAVYLHRQGYTERSFLELQIARQMDPLSLPVNSIFGSVLGETGRTDEAIRHLQETLELDETFPLAHAVLAHIYLGTGQPDLAVQHYERAYEFVPTSFYAGFLGHALARAGRTDDARDLLASLTGSYEQGGYISAGAIGWVHLGLGQNKEGYEWFGKAVRQRDVFLTIYGVLSNTFLTSPYKNDPGFIQIRSDAGFN
jgi:TolB-like protein/DNA-binding SARP family transcriptional activator